MRHGERAKGFWPKDRRGIAAMEFAVIGIPMAMLLFAAADFGMAIWQRLAMQSAVAAGASFAQVFPTQSAEIIKRIRISLPDSLKDSTIDPPTISCDCGGGGGTMSGGACSASCPAGSKRVFVTLSVSRDYSAFHFTAITGNSAFYVVRVQ